MNIVNLTPHAIVILLDDGSQRTIPPSGHVARASQRSTPVTVADGIPLVEMTYGFVDGLPPEELATLYIVSALVRLAMPDRYDLASPGDLVRDASGQPVGCRNLVLYQ